MKRFSLSTLCVWALGLALCASSCASNPSVSFDKNNDDAGSTEANPPLLRLKSGATRLDSLPEPPTRPDYQFVGWNTRADGDGDSFHEGTTVGADLRVYAQWELSSAASPGVEILPPAAALSPLKSIVSFSLTLALPDAYNPQETESVTLKVESALPTLVAELDNKPGENKRYFSVMVGYDEKNTFPEGRAPLHLIFEGLPEEYSRVVDVAIRDGLEKERAIPLKQDNIQAFNSYANTPKGLARHFQLVEDVVLEEPTPGKGNWTAIGTLSSPFSGSLDGNGFSLSGLVIHAPEEDYQGLFARIGPGALVENLGVLDGSVTGGSLVGGVVGYNNSGVVENSYATGNVSASGNQIGGVVGYNNAGTVQNCYAMGSVSADGYYVGGVVGENNSGTVGGSYATGSVRGDGNTVGGVVGYNRSGIVQNSYASGSVKGGANSVGGVVGFNADTVQHCYATGSVEGSAHYIGGVVGQNYLGTVESCVALNPSIRQTANNDTTLGRVVGHVNTDGTLTSNHARGDMVLTYGEENTPYVPDSSLGSKNGLSTSDYGSQNFWGALAGWNFINVWEWGTKNLPTLKGVGGEQNPGVLPLP